MSFNFALGLWMLLSSTSPSSRSPISLSRHLFSLLQPSFQWCRCCSQADCGGVSQGARQRQAHLPLAHSLSLLHSKFTSRLKVQGRMRGGLDQAKADLNSTLEAIQFLSPHHPPTFDAFVLVYTVAIHDTVLFCGSPQDLGRHWTASKDLGFGHHPQLPACRKSRQEVGQRAPRAQAPESQLHPRFPSTVALKSTTATHNGLSSSMVKPLTVFGLES